MVNDMQLVNYCKFSTYGQAHTLGARVALAAYYILHDAPPESTPCALCDTSKRLGERFIHQEWGANVPDSVELHAARVLPTKT
jgi:hypothetical protein